MLERSRSGAVNLAAAGFKVIKTLRGEQNEKWGVLIKGNTNYSPPKSFKEFNKLYPPIVEIGVNYAGEHTSDVATVTIGVCGPPYILPRADLFSLMEEEPPPGFMFHIKDFTQSFMKSINPTRNMTPSDSIDFFKRTAAAITTALCVLLLYLLRRRRK